jgi:hypothetical protein
MLEKSDDRMVGNRAAAVATAEASGCSLATAKIRIHRARARLRKALEVECDFYHEAAPVVSQKGEAS